MLNECKSKGFSQLRSSAFCLNTSRHAHTSIIFHIIMDTWQMVALDQQRSTQHRCFTRARISSKPKHAYTTYTYCATHSLHTIQNTHHTLKGNHIWYWNQPMALLHDIYIIIIITRVINWINNDKLCCGKYQGSKRMHDNNDDDQ